MTCRFDCDECEVPAEWMLGCNTNGMHFRADACDLHLGPKLREHNRTCEHNVWVTHVSHFLIPAEQCRDAPIYSDAT